MSKPPLFPLPRVFRENRIHKDRRRRENAPSARIKALPPVRLWLISGLLACPSCVMEPPPPVDRAAYSSALDAAADQDFHDRNREHRSAADAIRASGQGAPSYHYHYQPTTRIFW